MRNQIIFKTIKGVEEIHNQKIIHRDLKPDNILCKLSENNNKIDIKIIDFGCATFDDGKNKIYDDSGVPKVKLLETAKTLTTRVGSPA